ncbi:MAG: PaaI family thioesterase [Deltaproteobacteria bacterium]|nr:PaaI family thioesterase [Deltaproteobacteria bacterium]
MPELNPEHLKAAIIAINNAPFFRHLSMNVMEIGVGYSVVALDVGKEHMNPFGGLHGGVYASAIDTAAYWSAYCDLPEDNGLITIDIKVDFLAPVSGEKIIITGRRIKSGKTLYLTEAKMSDANGTVLAHGTSKLMVTRNKQSVNDLVKYIGSGSLPPKFLRS